MLKKKRFAIEISIFCAYFTFMKIVILSRSTELYSTRSIIKAGRRRGHYMIVLDHMNCDLYTHRGKMDIYYDGFRVKGISAIIPRIGTSSTRHGSLVIRHFMNRGVYSTLEPDALLKARNKFACLQILAFNGISVPMSILSYNFDSTISLKDKLGDPPYIIKLLKSTHGLGVLKADTEQQAQALANAFSDLRQKVLIQEFISESSGRDIRAFVVGDRVVAAMERVAREGEFRSNLHRGGVGYAVELTEDEEKIAINSCKLMGLAIAGVDILRSHSGPLIIEINASPGLEGIESAAGIDIAGEIIRFVERKVKHIYPF